LALLILADAVQVEPRRAPQHDVTACERHAELREDAVELDEAWVDEERRLGAEGLLRAREPERILEHGPHRVEPVAAARHPWQDVAHDQFSSPSVQLNAALAEPGDLLVDLERARTGVPLRLRLEPDRHVVALDVLA